VQSRGEGGDRSNGYRFYTRAAAEAVAAHEIRYASPIYLTEVLALWLAGGFRIREFSTAYIGRNEGLSKLRFVDLFKASLAVFEVSLRYHVTGFKKKAGVSQTARATARASQ
jgi:hypothetical protein